MSKGRKLVKGSALRVVDFFANAIIGLILMPFIVRSLGDKMYGLWIFVGSFIGYYGLFDLGLDSAVQRYISRALSLKDYNDVNRVVNTALFIFIIIGLISLTCTFVIVPAVPLLIKRISEVKTFQAILLILGLNFSITFPMRIFSGILSANIRYDLNTAVSILKLCVRTVLVVIFLKLGYGIMALTVITFAVNIMDYSIKYFIVKKLYKYILISRKFIDKSKIKLLFNYSLFTFIAQLADDLRFKIDNLVIVFFLGLNPVTLYSIAARLAMYFMQLVSATMGLLRPVFSQFEAKNDYVAIREKLIFTTKISSYLSIFIGGSLIVFGKAFIYRWMGKGYIDAYLILIILVVPLIIALMQQPTVQLLYGISKHKLFAIANMMEGVTNLILSIILVRKFGLIGVALGTAIPMVIVKLFIQPIYACRAIKLSIRKYYFELIVLPILKSLTVFMFTFLLLKNFIVPDYSRLFILVLAQMVLFPCIIFFIGFNNEEQGRFKQLIFRTN